MTQICSDKSSENSRASQKKCPLYKEKVKKLKLQFLAYAFLK